MGSNVGNRALVLGASVAGLLAARLLSDAYDEVVLVDRDRLAGDADARRTVPQIPHIHGLLARGQQVLEEMFPGFTQEMSAMGVPVGDYGTSLSWYVGGRMMRKTETGLVCVSPGRPLLEAWLREKVCALGTVRLVEESDVVGLSTADDGRRVVGARVRRRGAAGDDSVPADLVVDATGRGSRTPRWLRDLDYPPVPEERVKIDLTYTTADYRAPLPVDPIGDGVALVCVASPALPRGATLARLADRYSLSLYGMVGERPPTEPEAFLAYARSLPVPQIHDAVAHAQRLTDPVSMRFPANVRRRYERMTRLPDGLLVMGDAACVFNPIYAQGMTVAAVEATVLRRHLDRGRPPEPRAFFRDLSAAIDPAWDMAAGGDLGFPGAVGRRTVKVRAGNVLVPRLQAAATADGVLAAAFHRAAGLVDPPGALLRPAVLARVLRHRVGRRDRPSRPAPAVDAGTPVP